MFLYSICLIFITYTTYIKFSVISIKLLLLNMQVKFYSFFVILKNKLDVKFGFEKSINSNDTYDLNENFFNDSIDAFKNLVKKNEFSNSDSFIDRYDYTGLLEFVMEFFFIYKWFMLPFILFIGFIYTCHGLFGLYSAYVDYFQKNPDHINSYRAFIPAFSIFLFFIFIFFSLIFYLFILYLNYILWFLFI